MFWIETVALPGNNFFLQMQYTQTVILSFSPGPNNPLVNFPHISVATLVKQ